MPTLGLGLPVRDTHPCFTLATGLPPHQMGRLFLGSRLGHCALYRERIKLRLTTVLVLDLTFPSIALDGVLERGARGVCFFLSLLQSKAHTPLHPSLSPLSYA